VKVVAMNYGDIVGLEQGRRYAEARLARDIERRRVARERAQERRNREVERGTTADSAAGVAVGRTVVDRVVDAGSETADGARVEEARILIHS
jgi:hypothetical protein